MLVYDIMPMAEPCNVIDVEPVAALFGLLAKLIPNSSCENTWVIVPPLPEDVSAKRLDPLTPAFIKHCKLESECHIVDSLAVFPALGIGVKSLKPRFAPLIVTMVEPVAHVFLLVKPLTDPELNENPALPLESTTSDVITITLFRLLP